MKVHVKILLKFITMTVHHQWERGRGRGVEEDERGHVRGRGGEGGKGKKG